MKLLPTLFRGRSEPSLLDLLQRELDSDTLFQDHSSTLSEWRPRVNVEEKPDEYCVRADLPGVRKEDINIQVDNNTLTLKGHRQSEKEEKSENCLRMECSYGSFFRQITFTNDIDPKRVHAKLKNGVLELALPKQATPSSETIPIVIE